MKKNIKIISIMIFLVVISTTGYSQIQILDLNGQKNITKYTPYSQDLIKVERLTNLFLEDESEVTIIQISVDTSINLLSIKIEVKLTAGEIKVEVLNTENIVKENFTVINRSVINKGKNTQSKETVSGQLEKHFRDLGSGNWLIRIIPIHASGAVKVSRSLISGPKVDLMSIEELRY